MGMSKQTTFTLTLLAGLSVIVPGSAGYLSARMDAVERAHRELVSLESRIRQERLTAPVVEADRGQDETVAVPGMIPCDIAPRSQPRHRRTPAPSGPPSTGSGPGELSPAGTGAAAAGAAVPPRGEPRQEQGGPGREQDGSGQERAGQQSLSTDREHRRRHRERQERIGACAAPPGEAAPSSRRATEGTTRDRPAEDGDAATPPQAEAPEN